MTSPKTFLIGIIGFGALAAASMGGYLAARSDSTIALAPAVNERPAAQPAEMPEVPSPEVLTPGSATAPPTADVPAAVSARAARPVLKARPAVVERPVEGQPSRLPAEVIPAEAALPATPEGAAAAESTPAVGERSAAGAPTRDVPLMRELTVPENSVVGIRLETDLSSETAQLEDRVVARVTRDVKVDDFTAIPAGSLLEGQVTLVERGGKFRERARIGMRFTSLTLDAMRLPIETEAIFRDGQAPMPEATSKVGASAVVGTILGAVIGGKKGAAIGGAAGAAGGTAAVMAGGRNAAAVAAGTALTVRLTEPLAVSVKRD